MRILITFLMVAGLTLTGLLPVHAAVRDSGVLLESLFRFRVASQAAAQAVELGTRAGGDASEQIAAAASRWGDEANESIREDLETAMGDGAREAFAGFVESFSAAEASGDAAYLAALGRELRWPHPPEDYDTLRQVVVHNKLGDDIAESARFLGEVQTWIDVRRRSQGAPPLRDWLDRDDPPAPASAAPRARPPNPLRDAEAPAGEYRGGEEPVGNALDAFGSARGARRQKALEQAQAGMQQVAEERRTAEDELAAKKIAAAQAESEAVKKQAEKLAAAESEALEQRKNSWSGRLKQIATATIGAAGGAFFGGIGSRAGEAAAQAVFKN